MRSHSTSWRHTPISPSQGFLVNGVEFNMCPKLRIITSPCNLAYDTLLREARGQSRWARAEQEATFIHQFILLKGKGLLYKKSIQYRTLTTVHNISCKQWT